jgi:hypothetical protein
VLPKDMNRRGQGISINMVIIAAIALLVLIVAVILVSKSGRNIDENAGTQSCSAQGGICRAVGDCQSPQEIARPYRCKDTNYDCCIYNYNA